MKKSIPPATRRYCAYCKTITTFRYDKVIGHSRCQECGWHYIPTLDPMRLYEKEEQEFLRRKNNKK